MWQSNTRLTPGIDTWSTKDRSLDGRQGTPEGLLKCYQDVPASAQRLADPTDDLTGALERPCIVMRYKVHILTRYAANALVHFKLSHSLELIHNNGSLSHGIVLHSTLGDVTGP